MKIKLESLTLSNFKGIKSFYASFSDVTHVSGMNASGKTTLQDSFLWLLFNTDSHGNSNPPVRPVDENGQWINDIEVSVEANLLVDGEKLTLKKTQKQVWQTKRGETVSEYKGDTNSYEINGFPCTTQREYNEKVESIVEPKLFKLLTDPMAFIALPEKEQREILFRFVSDLTDEDVLDLEPDKYEPIRDDVLAAGSDKAREKAMKELRVLKDEMKAIPIRIDEATRQIENVEPIKELNQTRHNLEAELVMIANERDSLNDALKSVTDKQSELMKVKLQMGEIEAKVAGENRMRRTKAYTEHDRAVATLQELEVKRDRLCDQQDNELRKIADNEEERAALVTQYKTIRARAMPEDETICPTCGRPFDGKQLEEAKAKFDDRKTRDLGRVNTRGTILKSEIDDSKNKVKQYQAEIDALAEQIAKQTEEIERLKTAKDNVKEVRYMDTPEYKSLSISMTNLMEEILSMDNGDERKQALSDRQKVAQAALDEVKAKLAIHDANKRIETRIEALRVEQKETAQQVANQEQKLFLVEEYIKAKMSLLSDRINSKFESVRFKLFDRQKNGAVVPCCTMQVCTNGSYVDVYHANHSGMILGGLDVVKALSRLYDIYAPTWTDNAEAINNHLIPKMEQQMIFLSVSEDKELTITNE